MSTAPSPAELAARHGIDLDPAGLRHEEAGLDFQVVFGTDARGAEWVLRIPRRPGLAAAIEAEARVLRLARSVLAVAVPDWRVATHELVAYPLLPGSPGLTIDAAGAPVWHYDVESPVFAQSLGDLVAALHRVPVEEAAAAGVPVESPEEVRARFARELEQVIGAFDVATPLRDRWRRRLDDDGLWPDRTVLTHGELYAAHLLLADDDRILSVLDWTTARVTDPVVDLAYQHMVVSPETFARTVRAYVAQGHAVPKRLEERCTELIAAAPVAYALFALETGRPEHLDAARAQLAPT